ncbi:MAG: hypothetical protein WKF61_03465 [Luteimonas sp.]
MNLSTPQRTVLLTLLLIVMAATRANHLAIIPDASWAVFFVAGFYLRSWTRWAFPLLMAMAVAVDYFVISAQGVSFWQHYCVSPGYWFLLPAYFSLWMGGAWLQRHSDGIRWRTLGLTAASLFVAVVVCQLFSQGGFYWLSDSVANPTFAGWARNYNDWLWPFMQTTAIYVGIAAVVHAVMALSVAALPDLDGDDLSSSQRR